MSNELRLVGSLAGQAFLSASFTMEACSRLTEKFAALLAGRHTCVIGEQAHLGTAGTNRCSARSAAGAATARDSTPRAAHVGDSPGGGAGRALAEHRAGGVGEYLCKPSQSLAEYTISFCRYVGILYDCFSASILLLFQRRSAKWAAERGHSQ